MKSLELFSRSLYEDSFLKIGIHIVYTNMYLRTDGNKPLHTLLAKHNLLGSVLGGASHCSTLPIECLNLFGRLYFSIEYSERS